MNLSFSIVYNTHSWKPQELHLVLNVYLLVSNIRYKHSFCDGLHSNLSVPCLSFGLSEGKKLLNLFYNNVHSIILKYLMEKSLFFLLLLDCQSHSHHRIRLLICNSKTSQILTKNESHIRYISHFLRIKKQPNHGNLSRGWIWIQMQIKNCDRCTLKSSFKFLKIFQSYDVISSILVRMTKMVYICVWDLSLKII